MNENTFEIIPAIDILDSKCVRLTQGNYNKVEEFSSNPEEIAKKWIDLGASRLHIVDLNGAKSGYPINQNIIYRIARLAYDKNTKIEVGGGIRTHKSIKEYLNEGVNYIILGTKAFQDKAFVSNMTSLYKEQIILGLDMKNDRIALSGWQETIETNIKKLQEEIGNIKQIIYTDISKDGMLTGPNLKGLAEISSTFKSNIIASGGISSMENILKILSLKKQNHPNITGVILGKSLYKGTINLSEAIELTKMNLSKN